MKVSRFRKMVKWLNFYPPFIGAGIRIKEVSPRGNRYEVEMKLRWYNRNVYGSHFGGSLYAMSDPFFVFAAYAYFGDDYILWDKSAKIKFKRPGRGKVRGIFEIEIPVLEQMKEEVDRLGKKTFTLYTTITDEENLTVAEIEKEIYIRKKTDK